MNLLYVLGVASMIFVAAFTYHAAFLQTHTGGQTPRGAIAEAWVNIVLGFSVNLLANVVMIPLMSSGGTITFAANFWGGWVYTAISIVRQYAVRRWFNAQIKGLVARLVGGAA